MKKIIAFVFIALQVCMAFTVNDVNLNENNLISFSVSDFDFKEKVSTLTSENIFDCDIPLKGIYEYRNENSIIFYPEQGLAMGKIYNCKNKEQNFEIITPEFRIKSIKKIGNSSVLIGFNDFVDTKVLNQNLTIYKAEKLSKNKISYKTQTSDDKNFIITLNSNETNINIEIANSLTSKFGAKLKNDTKINLEKDVSFFQDNLGAVNLQELIIRPHAFSDGILGARIYFTNYIKASSKHIKIDGISQFSLSDVSYLSYSQKGSDLDLARYYYYVDIKSNDFKPNTMYNITILKGFGDEYTLNREEKTFSITTGDRLAFADFTDDKTFIPKNSVISFKSTNISEIKVIIKRINDQNYRYFLNFDKEDVSRMSKEIISKNFTLSGLKNEILEHKINLDFKDFKDGVYEISLFYKNDKTLKSVSKVAYISDITALATLSRDGIFLLTTRLSDATILPQSDIKIYSSNNELLLNSKSDENGIFSYNEPFFSQKNPVSVVISKGDEQSFVLLNEAVNGYSNLNFSDRNTTSQALIYYASKIIRPGENIKGIISFKNADFTSVKNLPVKFKIINPDGETILNKNSKTDEYGIVSFDEKMADKTGIYSLIAVYESKVLAKEQFSVENFMPDRIKSDIFLEKDEFFKNELIKAKFISNYLFGAPASNLSASSEIAFFDKDLKFDNYKNFSFKNKTYTQNTSLSVQNISFKLDENGIKEMVIYPDLNKKISNAYNVKIGFSVLDGNKNTNTYKNITVYPYSNIVGISCDKNFINYDEEVKITTIVLDSVDKKEIDSLLDIEIYKNEFNYVFSDDGRYHEQRDLVLVDSFKNDNNGFKYKFNNSGNYIIVANDYLNGSSASVEIDVSGYGYYGRQNPQEVKQAVINIDKKSYKPGEIIKGSVNSAINKGVLYVSLVNRDILDYKVMQISQNETPFELKIPANFEGGHINAVVFKDSNPSVLPQRTHASKAVMLDQSDLKIPLDIVFEKKAKNNETVKINVKTSANSKVILFAADEGALQIVKQKELDAFSYFNNPLEPGYEYFDIFDDLSTYQSNAKALSFGGDAFMSDMLKDISPIQAKNIKTFQIMQSKISDENGTAQFQITTPNNFNSKIRLTAISIRDDSIGSANEYLEVKDDIVIKPANMVYFIQGDEIDFPLTLINTTSSNKDLSVRLNFSENINIDTKELKFNLKPMQSINTKFPLYALKLGNGDLNISVNDTKQTFINNINFDIISQYPVSKYNKTGYTDKPIKFTIPDSSYKKLGISISSTPNVITSALAKQLENYAYGCTEQISSKLLGYEHIYKTEKTEKDKAKDNILYYSRVLLSRLKSNGSFGFWNEYGKTDIYASVYAADVLLELDKKHNIIGDMQRNLIFSYLKIGHSDNFIRMYADYVLNKHSKLSKNEINYIYDNEIFKTDIVSLYMMAEILKTNSMNSELSTIMSNISSYEYVNQEDENTNFSSEMRNIAFTLYIHARNFDKNNFSEKLARYLSKNTQHIYSTQERAFVLRALDEYYKNDNKNVEFDLTVNDKSQKFGTSTTKIYNLKNETFSITPKNHLYYNILSYGNEKLPIKHQMYNKQNYFDRNYSDKNTHFEIYREFVDDKGNYVDLNSLKVGDTIYSKINMISNHWLRNVIVDEPVSSCFEIINERLYEQAKNKNLKNTVEFEHREIKDERVITSLDPFSMEVVFFTPYKVVISGKCKLPAVKAQYMRNESINDYDLQMLEFNVKE